MDRSATPASTSGLAERFHTTVTSCTRSIPADARPAPRAKARATPASSNHAAGVRPHAQPSIQRGQLVRVPNAGVDRVRAGSDVSRDWLRILASLGVDSAQPDATRIVVDKSDGWLKAYDAAGKLRRCSPSRRAPATIRCRSASGA